MSTTIDERVVEMRFDNKQFENNVQTSLSTLDKLKQSLNLTGASKGLENVDLAAKRIDFSPLSNGIEVAKTKFSALELMAVTALINITDQAVNAGKRLVSAFTIDPVKSGFAEYETQINAVQTILANTESKGSTLKDVNAALDELNLYADKTIYNFTEMTRNIGTFTAAGVDLDTSVAAIKGIANLAAVSGSTSQQASTAMYQLSQALAAGTVKLQDWNSVVNAGMGGQVFQDALKETARVHGIAIDQMIEDEGSFRETLQKGWLTSEILTETLQKFTGDLNEEQLKTMGYSEEQIKSILKMGQTANDAATKVKTFTQLFDTLKEAAQSGWTQSWEIIVGDFEEAKELLTEISDTFSGIIGDSANARNELLQGWKNLGGRTALIESLRNAFEGIMSIIEPVKEAFREVFPPTTAQQLYDITEKIRDITAKIKLSSEESEKLKSTFKGLFSVIGIGVDFVKTLIVGISKLLSNLTGLGGGVLNVTGSIGDFLTSLRESINESGIFVNAVNGITNFIQKAIDKLKEFVAILKTKISIPGFDGVLSVLTGIWGIVTKIASKIGSIFSSAIGNGGIKSILSTFNSGVLAAILLNIKNFTKDLKGSFEGIPDFLESIGGVFESWQQNIKAKTLKEIAIAIGILAASLLVISLIDSDKIAESLVAMGGLFGELMVSMLIFGKMQGAVSGLGKTALSMTVMATSILILATALKKIASLNLGEIARGLVGLAGVAAILVTVAKIMSTDGTKMVKGAAQMLIMSASLTILAADLKIVASLGWSEIARGLVGLAGALTAMVSALAIMSAIKGSVLKSSSAILIMAGAITVLTPALMLLGSMSWKSIAKSLLTLAGAFTIFGVAGFALKPLVPTLLALSAAMALFGAGILALGAGLLAASIAISSLGASLVVLSASIVAVILGIVSGLGDIIVAACDAIIKSAPAIAEAIVTVVTATCNALRGSISPIVDTVLEILVKVLNSLRGYIPSLVNIIVDILVDLMDQLAVRIPDLTNSAVGLLSAFMKSLGEALGQGNADNILSSFESIAGVFVALGVTAKLLSTIPISGAITAIADLGILVGGMAVILTALGGLAQIPGFEWIIGEGSRVLGLIGTAIGSFVGNIVGSFAEGLTSTFPQIGIHLSDFMTNLKPFIEGAKEVDSSIFTSMASLAGAILCITGADIISGIASFFTGDNSVDKFGEDLKKFGEGLKGFADAVDGVDPTALTAASNAAKALADMTDHIPNKGGMVSWFTGDNSVSDFGEDLKKLGEGLKGFADAVNGVNPVAITMAASAAKALADMTNSIPNTDGMKQWFSGEKSISKFGGDLKKFGEGLKGFADTVDGVNPITITAASNAAKALADMTNSLPDDTGNVKSFGENIATFGSCLGEYYCRIADISTDNIDLSSKIVDGLNKIATVNADKVRETAGSIQQLADALSKVSDIKGDAGSGFAKALEEIASVNVDAFIASFNDAHTSIYKAGQDLVDAFDNGAKSKKSSVLSSGKEITAQFTSGINNQEEVGKATKAFDTILSACLNTISSYNDEFYTAGMYAATGFANGISSNTFMAIAKASEMANSALVAARQALRINSPSKEFYAMGAYSGEGFINALDDYKTNSYKAGASIAESAKEGLSKSIYKVKRLIDTGIDTQPRIRPVMDLSDVTAGANTMNKLLNGTPSIEVMSKVRSINSSMNERIQNGNQNDVISAIKDLGRKLGDSSGNTYTINGVTYDDGSNISEAVKAIVQAARIERRV